MDNFRSLTRPEVRELLDKTLFKTFFHSLEWHEFLEKEFSWLKFEYYLYKDALLFPVAKAGNKFISLPFCEYGGPSPLGKNINLEEFEKDALKKFQNIKIKFHPRVKPGNAESDVSTHWIENLKSISEDELWMSFRKTLRHEIKNAQERGVEIRTCKNQKDLKSFYDLYVTNLRRKKTIPYPWPLLQFCGKNPSGELLLAFYKGRIIGGDLFLNYSGFVHYFLSASDYRYRDFSAAHLLLWEKMKSLIGKDVILDLGATPRHSSLDVFKSGWGGKEYPILQIGIKRSAENLRSSKLRNIWGLLPNFIIKAISPFLIKYRI